MNELTVLMHLLSKKENKFQIGATKKDILKNLNIKGKNKSIYFQNIITHLSNYLEPLGLQVRFNPLNACWYISFDPETLIPQELSLLEKETTELEKKREERLSADLFDLLEFVDRLNKVGDSPSYKDVGDEFKITRTTARKRIKELIDKGLLLERKSGRFKHLVLTERGKYSL